MGHWIGQHLTYLFVHYGYWTVFFGVFLESAGVPLPGETILIAGSILASTHHHEMSILYVALTAMVAAILGDNLGYLAGSYGGRPLLRRYRRFLHVSDQTMQHGQTLFRRHDSMTVFFARFVAALRFLAGPLAGVLGMEWRRFLLFNALGAVAWVSLVTTLAYLFGPTFEHLVRRATWVVLIAAGIAAVYLWRKHVPAEEEPVHLVPQPQPAPAEHAGPS